MNARIHYCAIAVLALVYAPSAEAQISDVTEIYRSGDIETALQMLDRLRQEYPDDVDYMLLRAQIFAQQGRDDRALDELRIATSVAPHYEDPWRLRHTLLQRTGDDDYQSERSEVAVQVQRQFPNAGWWRMGTTRPGPQWSVLVGAGYDRLDNDAPSWNRVFTELSRESESSARHWLGVARDSRFSTSDITLTLGSSIPIANRWTIAADYSIASNPAFMPDSVLGASVSRSFDKGWGVTIAYRYRDFPTVSVGTTTLATERYMGAFRFAYALNATHLDSAGTSFGHGFTSNWYYDDKASIGLTLSAGTEAEAIGPGQVLESRVRSAALTGRRALNEKFALQWWLGLHDQGDFYRRQFLGMAVSIKL